jgi:hypothetical protein
VTLLTQAGRAPVNHYCAPGHLAPVVMTEPARNPVVRAPQREGRVPLVVKPGWLPVRAGVATSAVRGSFLGCLKLSVMGVGMTGTAKPGCPREGNQPFSAWDLRLVTASAGGGTVLARQWVASGVVVKWPGLLPVPGCVTGFAACLLNDRGSVWILVALEATGRREVKLRLRRFGWPLVTVGAGHRQVGPRQRHP